VSFPPISLYLLYGSTGAVLVGMGIFSLATIPHVFRKILAWNALGSGIFLIIGAIASRNAVDGVSDPLPQAIVITGIVVSVSATALALVITRRLHQLNGDNALDLAQESDVS
jgi:multicomponent Na+:H+ antiporter subunit C